MITYPNINPIFIQIGPFSIKWYGISYLIGILFGFFLIRKKAYQKLNLNFDQLTDFAFYILLGIILGGRLGYIFFYDLVFYLKHPLEIFAIWHGGMSFHGASIGTLLASYVYSKKQHISYLNLLDLLCFGAPIGLGFGRIANFINGELFGRPSNLPWAMVFPYAGNIPRHPSQLYEAFFEGLILFLILFFLYKKPNLKSGSIFIAFTFFYGIFRFFLEFFRAPDPQIGLFFNTFSLGQCLSFVMIIIAFMSYYKIRHS